MPFNDHNNIKPTPTTTKGTGTTVVVSAPALNNLDL